MHLNKKHTAILFVLFILSFGLSFAFLEYKDAKSNTSETLGVETLADADYYESIKEHKPDNIDPADLESPQVTRDFQEPLDGFSIKTSQREVFENVFIEVRFEDGTYSDKLVVHETDAHSEEDPDDIFFTDLFTFTKKITQINAYYQGDYEFEIMPVDNDAQDNMGMSLDFDVESAAFYAEVAAEQEYKTRFLNAINLNIIPREDWGAPTISMWENPLVYDADRIVVHHTATGVASDPADTVKAIYNDHAYNRGWLDIGYNYLIAPNGAIYEGRGGGNGVRGAHAIPNSNTIGISLLGNYQDQQPTTAAISSLQKLIGVLGKFNDVEMTYRSGTYAPNASRPSGIYPHATYNSDYPTACPGQNLRNILPQVVENAKAYKNYRPQVSNVANEATDLTTNREMQRDGGYVEVIVDTTGLSSLLKSKLKTESRGITSYRELGNTLVYKVEEDKVKQVVAETKLVAPTTKAQPNFIYKTSEGWVDDGERSYPDDDYNTSTHWNLEKINMPEAWDELGGCASDSTCGGDSSVVIAVLDTGVAYENHNYDAGTDYFTTKIGGLYVEVPATEPGGGGYTPTYNEGYDRQYYQSPELDNSKFVHPYDSAQEYLCALRASDGDSSTNCNTTELAKRYRANDDHGHGTFVTSIIAANVDDTGINLVTGMAHNVNIMPIKVFLPNDRSMCQDESGNLDETCSNSYYDYRTVATSYTLVKGIEHAVDNGADVINMSLTGRGTDPYVEAAIDEAVAANTVVVAAAGNYNTDIANYFPASFQNVIAVGATDEGNNRASYSNYGDELDIVAPVGDSGQIIASHTYSCYPSKNNCSDETNPNIFQSFYDVNEEGGNTMAKNIGTSFAAPQVAAAAGLARYANPNLSTLEIKTYLKDSASDINTTGWDSQTGYGLLDINKLINYTQNVFVSSIDFQSNPNFWNLNNSSNFVSGDFNNDTYPDYASLYQTSNYGMQIWVYASNGDGTYTPEKWYECGPGCWDINRTSGIVSGDFDGNGTMDIATMYKYGGYSIKMWNFVSNGVDSFSPEIWYSCGPGCWDTNRSNELSAGDFDGDGDDDIASMYQYGGYSIKLWNFVSNGTDTFTPEIWYSCGPGCWDVNRSMELTSGDYNGDGNYDIASMYQYGGYSVKLWNFISNGTTSFDSEIWYACGSGCWDINRSTNLTSGDYDNDGDDDIASMYQYGGYSIGIWNFSSNNTDSFNARKWYTCGSGCWDINRSSNLFTEDFDKSGKYDIGSVYQYGSSTIKMWAFDSFD